MSRHRNPNLNDRVGQSTSQGQWRATDSTGPPTEMHPSAEPITPPLRALDRKIVVNCKTLPSLSTSTALKLRLAPFDCWAQLHQILCQLLSTFPVFFWSKGNSSTYHYQLVNSPTLSDFHSDGLSLHWLWEIDLCFVLTFIWHLIPCFKRCTNGYSCEMIFFLLQIINRFQNI